MRIRSLWLALLLLVSTLVQAQFKAAADTGGSCQARATLETGDPTGGFVFSADSATVWLAAGRSAQQWDVATGKRLQLVDYHSADNPDWHMGAITAMVGSPDHALIVSGDRDGNIKFWQPADGKVLATIATVSQGSPVNSLAFAPAGDVVASTNRSKTIYLWDVKAHRKKATLDTGNYNTFEYVRYLPSGASLVTMDNTSKVLFYSATSGVKQKTYDVAGQTSSSHNNVWISPDGRLLATGGDKEGHIYDAATGRLKFTLPHEGWVVGIAFSRDGKWIATASHDKTLKLWNAATGKIKATCEGHYGGVNTVAFSPDSKTLISGAASEARLWDVP
jgi:WD40 repeat protein